MKTIKLKRTDKIIIGVLIAAIALAGILSAISRRSDNVTAESSGDLKGEAQIVRVSDFNGKSLIKIEHLRKEYPNVTPLKDVSVEINKGDVISVIGPSGTGKSTLLRCLNRLEEPTSGSVTLDGEVITSPACDITRVRRRMGMVFQSFNLFNNLTVIENIMAGPVKLLKVPREQAYKEGMELLEWVGLAEKENVYPDSLSGGQKQRVAIVRAIAMHPEIILFDEPTSALQSTLRQTAPTR